MKRGENEVQQNGDPEDLWRWLAANPNLTWLEVANATEVTAISLIRRVMAEADSPAQGGAHVLHRYLNQYFPQGWNASDRLSRAKLAGKLASRMMLADRRIDIIMARMDEWPPGWKSKDPADPQLVALLESAFAVPNENRP